MSFDELIHRLAERAGIQPLYQDIWGHGHAASREAKQVLLAAMGIACADEAAAQTSLRQWEAAEWRALLPPVQVHPQGPEPVRLSLHLPAGWRDRSGHWQLTRESGATTAGTFHAGELPELARTTLDDGDYLALGLTLPPCDEAGHHRLRLSIDGLPETQMPLIVCPPTCHRPPALEGGGRVWGVSVQLYGVRSRRNWGMGDFTDLADLATLFGRQGAALIGVNPLHALYPHNPEHCSPYSPSSRQFLNVLYIDVEAVPDFAECAEAQAAVAAPAFQAQLAALRAAPLVDYAGVAAAKFPLLERLYAHFRAHHLARDTARAAEFRRFVAQGGEDLHRFALYEALQAHFHARNTALWGWPAWPEDWRDPLSPQVVAWAEANAEQVEYRLYLQWLAAVQLERASQAARAAGMAVGLYMDLAVGVDRGGAETWMHRKLYAFEASVGAPPDDFNLHGQDWGLPPLSPHRLRDAAYAPFIGTLRANMAAAGALRIDHVMALLRLYWVPPGLRADQGVYVAYPLQDLVGILALESRRAHCLVVGEDLGTVPDAMRAAMHERDILAYRLFYFEKHWEGDHRFKAPHEIGHGALVAASTHDLPTLCGFWRGSDLEWRARLNLFPSEAMREAQIVNRAQDRARLLWALHCEGLLPEGVSLDPAQVTEMTHALRLAIHRYLARSAAPILLVQAEDLLGEVEQANLPGTVAEHPNWRRKLSLPLEDWATDARIVETARALSAERGQPIE